MKKFIKTLKDAENILFQDMQDEYRAYLKLKAEKGDKAEPTLLALYSYFAKKELVKRLIDIKVINNLEKELEKDYE